MRERRQILRVALPVLTLLIGAVAGYLVASRSALEARRALQLAVVKAAFGEAVDAARSGDPGMAAQGQRSYLAISKLDEIRDWPAYPLVIETQQVAAYVRLGIALEAMGETEHADEALQSATTRAAMLARRPDVADVWRDKTGKDELVAWINEVDRE